MKKNIFFFLLTIFLLIFVLILALIFDSQFFILIQALKCPATNAFFSWLIFIEKEIIFYPLIIVLTLILLLTKKRKEKILPYFLSLAIVIIITVLLKIIVARPRPNLISNHSFPSGHTSMLFTSLPFFNKIKSLEIVWIVGSSLLMLARIWFNLHYLSDIVGGAIIGYCIPLIINKYLEKRKNEKKWN